MPCAPASASASVKASASPPPSPSATCLSASPGPRSRGGRHNAFGGMWNGVQGEPATTGKTSPVGSNTTGHLFSGSPRARRRKPANHGTGKGPRAVDAGAHHQQRGSSSGFAQRATHTGSTSGMGTESRVDVEQRREQTGLGQSEQRLASSWGFPGRSPVRTAPRARCLEKTSGLPAKRRRNRRSYGCPLLVRCVIPGGRGPPSEIPSYPFSAQTSYGSARDSDTTRASKERHARTRRLPRLHPTPRGPRR